MQKENKTWLAAVSGGPDSMAMLDMCIRQGMSLAAAHVNYHHRPEADAEEAYVKDFCLKHGIRLFVKNDPFIYEGNFEAAARKHRYDFFAEIVKENGYAGVLVAHQEDDLIETYIMQKEKNIVPEYYGLKEEMMYHGILIRRPLLSHTKKQLEDYCNDHQIRYFIDATNSDDTYTRNRIRRTVAPLSAFERNMIRQKIMKENAVLQERRCRVRTYIRDEKTDLSSYRRLPYEEREALLRELCEEKHGKRMSGAHLKQIDEILMNKNDFVIPVSDRNIVQENGSFFLQDLPEPYEYVYENLDQLQKAEGKYFRIETGEPGVNALTLHESDWPLTIRSWKAGDEIMMRFGTKSVHRFFIDRHIPQYQRETWPVVENASKEVILIPGLGCDKYHFSRSPDINVLQCAG